MQPVPQTPDVTVESTDFKENWHNDEPVLDVSSPTPEEYRAAKQKIRERRFLTAGDARYLVDFKRRRILCDLDIASHMHLLALIGPVMSFIMLGMELEPLHGSALVKHGKAIMLIGESGSGKSTLAAELIRRGWDLLADDLVVPRIADNSAVCYPGCPVLKLRNSTHKFFSSQEDFAKRRWVDVGKFLYPMPMPERGAIPFPLLKAYLLDSATGNSNGRFSAKRVSPADFSTELVKNTYNSCVTDKNRIARQFEHCVKLAQLVDGIRLCFRHNFTELGEVAAYIEACQTRSGKPGEI